MAVECVDIAIECADIAIECVDTQLAYVSDVMVREVWWL